MTDLNEGYQGTCILNERVPVHGQYYKRKVPIYIHSIEWMYVCYKI
jgi:hypothetical protein